jgi:hypothetical protein
MRAVVAAPHHADETKLLGATRHLEVLACPRLDVVAGRVLAADQQTELHVVLLMFRFMAGRAQSAGIQRWRPQDRLDFRLAELLQVVALRALCGMAVSPVALALVVS